MDRSDYADQVPRPSLRRSVTASPEVTSPREHKDKDSRTSRVSAIPSQAARRLHLHTRGVPKEPLPRLARHQQHQSGSRHNHHSHAAHSPAHAVKEAAKTASSKVHSTAHAAYESRNPGQNRSAGDSRLLSEDAGRRSSTRPVRPEDLAAERKRHGLRDEELDSSLKTLTDLATSMTRQLDTTFYAILEKAEQLRKMVGQLQQLSADSTTLHQRFEEDAGQVREKTENEIDQFKAFKEQGDQVAGLESRMKVGTERAERLSARLEQARNRVAKWQEREAEWQSKTRTRLRASGITTGCVAGAIFLLLLLRWLWLKRQEEVGLEARLNDTGRELSLWDLRHTFSLPFRDTIPRLKQQALGDDKRLQLLDDL